MRKQQQPQHVSPLIKGGIFGGPHARNKAPKRAPEGPEFSVHLADYSELTTTFLRNLSVTADALYPSTRFLCDVPGSKIEKNVRMSYILAACFDLSPMKLNPSLVENYKQTLKSYLSQLPRNAAEYTQLLDLIKTYEAIADCMKSCTNMKLELNRLNSDLGLPPKTIDKRLRNDWVQPAVVAPIKRLAQQTDKLLADTKASGASPSIELALTTSQANLDSLASVAVAKPQRAPRQAQSNPSPGPR